MPDALPETPEFVFLGGHVAIDFANTGLAEGGRVTELLNSWQDVQRWLNGAGISAAPGKPSTDGLEKVRKLRDDWRVELEKFSQGQPVGASFLKRLNEHLAADTFSEKLVQGDARTFRIERSESALRGESWVLACMARQIAILLVEVDFTRVHRCANPACILYFHDTTKNHRRQWCSNALCGNRHKVAAFREREARKAKGRRRD